MKVAPACSPLPSAENFATSYATPNATVCLTSYTASDSLLIDRDVGTKEAAESQAGLWLETSRASVPHDNRMEMIESLRPAE